MANIQDTITRLPVHARRIGVGAVAAGAYRVCVHTQEEQRGGGGSKDSVKITTVKLSGSRTRENGCMKTLVVSAGELAQAWGQGG